MRAWWPRREPAMGTRKAQAAERYRAAQVRYQRDALIQAIDTYLVEAMTADAQNVPSQIPPAMFALAAAQMSIQGMIAEQATGYRRYTDGVGDPRD